MARTYDSHAITTALGLPRPFDTYAPRTQRRYAKAYREGITREETLRRERQQRAAQPRERAKRAARAIRRMGMNPGGAHDWDNIERLGDAVGWDEAAGILEAQRDVIAQYKETRNTAPGRANWSQRDAIEMGGEDFVDVAPYFYYRA